jgi:hypothetical protein
MACIITLTAIKSRKMRWVGLRARMTEIRNAYQHSGLEDLEERDQFEDLDIDWRIILKWILYGSGVWWCNLASTGS